MAIDPAVLSLIETFGPIVLGIVGTILAGVFTGCAAAARWAWTTHNRRMQTVADALNTLAQGLKTSEERVEGEHKKIWDAIQGLRAELQLSNRNTDTIKVGLMKVEGALESHRGTLYQHIEKLGILDGKLGKLFEYVDAPRRATDRG